MMMMMVTGNDIGFPRLGLAGFEWIGSYSVGTYLPAYILISPESNRFSKERQ
jgi:hypothetical protein